MTERDIFMVAVQRDAVADRLAYVSEACQGDELLRQGVEALLAAHDRAGSFLASPALAAATSDGLPITEGPGAVMGPYKLLEEIGEGGFGVVFMAEQQRPVRRKVALKVIKPGMDSRQVIARFEAERQALALMDHPNIARVFDAGETSSGRPYFVMELVRGVPITDFCDANPLSVPERLELFVSVCQGVQHAHHKGIIHRDLKPSNVLVTLHDGTPVVKIIDFGISKALGQRLTESTLFTNFAQLLGTPIYMSPEQAEMSGLDIDTRSDIYSLGVLLYELLTGTTPRDKERLRTAPFDEVRRIIREEEPARPSMQISTLGQAAALTVSANRQSDPRRLSQLFRGDLDWIVMKALEKDRNRRYETASAFVADVQRYLNDEPVLACPPSFWYRFRKLARRNKGAFVAASAAALVVVLALVGLVVSNVLIRQEQARTRDEKDRAEKAQRLAQDRAEEIQEGLERLKAANASLDLGRLHANERQWDDAYAAFTKAAQLRPDHVAVWVERADLCARLGLWDLAAADFAEENALREPDATTRWYRHALLRLYVGDDEGYRKVCQTMHDRFSGTLLEDFAGEVIRTCILAPGPDADLASVVDLAQNALADHPGSWYWLYLLGMAQYRAGQYELAVHRLRASLLGYPDGATRAMSYPVLAMAHHRLGQTAEAREALDAAAEAIDRWTQDRYQFQEGHYYTHHGATAHWPITWSDWLECQHYYREAKVLIDGSPPPDDPRLHVLRARAFAGLRWSARAIPEYDAALKLSPQDLLIRGEAHHNRAYRYIGLQQWGEAAAEFAKACEVWPSHSDLWLYRGVAHLADGDVDAYRQTCTAMLERFETTEDGDTAANVLQVCVLRDDALADMARLLPLTRVAEPIWHWGTWVRGAALYRAGRFEESVVCFETAAKMFRPRAWDWCFLAMAHHRLGHTEEARRCLVEAARWIDEANRVRLDDPTGLGPVWGAWHEPVVYPLLLREAETLLNNGREKN
jgi:eukaryotic-like serine/threonine-protein kinase